MPWGWVPVSWTWPAKLSGKVLSIVAGISSWHVKPVDASMLCCSPGGGRLCAKACGLLGMPGCMVMRAAEVVHVAWMTRFWRFKDWRQQAHHQRARKASQAIWLRCAYRLSQAQKGCPRWEVQK